jgi:hypothetical protein
LVEFTTKEFLCLVAPTSVNNYFPEWSSLSWTLNLDKDLHLQNSSSGNV